jgi:hypothetical protein
MLCQKTEYQIDVVGDGGLLFMRLVDYIPTCGNVLYPRLQEEPIAGLLVMYRVRWWVHAGNQSLSPVPIISNGRCWL